MTVFAKRVLMVVLAFCIVQKEVNAEILFNGDWANYLGRYYDQNGWKNITARGKPTPDAGWSDIIALWSPPLPHTWLFSTSYAENRIQLVTDVTSPKKGVVARFEVRSGDHRLNHSGERSEMIKMLGKDSQKLPVTENSGREFYAVSIKLNNDWKGPQPTKWGSKWGSFMQLHSPNAYNSPPAIHLAVGEEFAVEMNAGELVTLVKDEAGVVKKVKKDNTYFKLSNGDLRKGHWVQLVLEVMWKKDSSGFVKVYRRDEGDDKFYRVLALTNIPTLQTSKHIPTDLKNCPSCALDNIVHYWRVGYYRSTSLNQTNVLWLGPIVRGTNFNEVAKTAFGQTGAILNYVSNKD